MAKQKQEKSSKTEKNKGKQTSSQKTGQQNVKEEE